MAWLLFVGPSKVDHFQTCSVEHITSYRIRILNLRIFLLSIVLHSRELEIFFTVVSWNCASQSGARTLPQSCRIWRLKVGHEVGPTGVGDAVLSAAVVLWAEAV